MKAPLAFQAGPWLPRTHASPFAPPPASGPRREVLEAARNITTQKIKAADAVFVAALANTTNITRAGVNKIEQGLIEAEKEEIKRVRR